PTRRTRSVPPEAPWPWRLWRPLQYFCSLRASLLFRQVFELFVAVGKRTCLHLLFVGEICAAGDDRTDEGRGAADALGDVPVLDLLVLFSVVGFGHAVRRHLRA